MGVVTFFGNFQGQFWVGLVLGGAVDDNPFADWAYAITFAADVWFQIRDQIRNPRKKLHLELLIKKVKLKIKIENFMLEFLH